MTERKHRDWKRLTQYIFASYEHASIKEFVNFAVQEYVSGRFKFAPHYLIDPEEVTIGTVPMRVSWKAATQVGEIRRGDVVATMIGGAAAVVGEVKRFIEIRDEITVETMLYTRVRGDNCTWSTDAPTQNFIDIAAIRANLIWAPRRRGVITVLMPPGLHAI